MNTSNMKNFKLIFLTIFLLFNLKGNTQNQFYPLAKGKKWIYKYSESFSNTPGQKSIAEILRESQTINGKEYLVIQTSLGTDESSSVIQSAYVRNGDNGSILGIDDAKQTKEYTFLPEKPWNKGTSWQSDINGNSTTSTIVNINGNITTPEKTYTNCLVVEVNSGQTLIRSYYKENIGIVAVSLIISNDEKLLQYLISY